MGQPGLEIHSKSSWNDDIEAAPGEDNVLGVGGYEKLGFVFAEFCSSGREDDADALDAWLPSSKLIGGCRVRLDMGLILDPGRAEKEDFLMP